MKKVYPNIFLIEEKGRFGPSDNIYVIAGKDGLIFDAGYGYKKAIKHFLKEFKEIKKIYEEEEEKFRVNRILVSHAHSDHFSGLKRISDKLSLKIILTEKIAETIQDKVSFNNSFHIDDYEDHLRIRREITRKIINFFRNLGARFFFRRIHGLSYLKTPDKIISENSDILINGEDWQLIPAPGHSSEHIALFNMEKGVLLSGDNVLHMKSTWLGPPESNLSDYKETIKKFQSLHNLKLILPAHGEIIKNPNETLIAILDRMEEREKKVLKEIKTHSTTGVSPD
ncbi:MAG: MBL fold metallo-hydrolase, partial [Promethearchaeota archaeon]